MISFSFSPRPVLTAAHEKQLSVAYDALRHHIADGSLSCLNIMRCEQSLTHPDVATACKTLSASETLVIVGVGGSSLSARLLDRFASLTFPEARRPALVYWDRIEPYHLADQIRRLDLAHTRFLIVSKSGDTLETLVLTSFLEDLAQKSALSLAQRAVVVTEERPSRLRDWAQQRKIPTLPHDPDMGGRCSFFSLVGMIPALCLGLSPQVIFDGATDYLRGLKPYDNLFLSVAWHVQHEAKSTHVLFTYAERLSDFARWHRQLWAESLGKDRNGTTPTVGTGSLDQHSQLQMYLDGRKDKLFTFLVESYGQSGPTLRGAHPLMADITATKAAVIYHAQQQATMDVIHERGHPTRVMTFDALDQGSLGAAAAHFIAETLLTAAMWNIPPFGQPAVEEGKQKTLAFLKTTNLSDLEGAFIRP
jgi:glucose-6-phosphate isomerase